MNENSTKQEPVAEQSHREYLPPTAEEKAHWVKRFVESGLSIRKFSDQHGIPRMSLWRWAQNAQGEGSTSPSSSPPQFTELKLSSGLARSDWAIELALPNGTILRMTKETPPAIVEQLLRLC